MPAAAEQLETLEREATLSEISRIARYLQEHLGQRVTAYLSGIKDAKMVGQWAKGRRRPRDPAAFRLRQAYPAARLLVETFGNETAKAWFFGTNLRLDDEAPAYVLRYGENPDDFRFVLPAARAFVEGGAG